MKSSRHRSSLISRRGRSTEHLNSGQSDHRRHGNRRLGFESLEDRRLLAVFSVSNLNDMGAGSLRDAINMANGNGEANTINFSVEGTINIASELPTITSDLGINGGSRITIDAGHGMDNEFGTGDGYRIFNIDDGDANTLLDVSLNGLKLVGGDASEDGGAVRSLERLNVTVLEVNRNASTGYGGGFSSSGEIILSASSVTENYAANRGGGLAGNSSFMDIRDSTISGNSGLGGGGIFNQYRSTFIENSSIIDNTARNIGGGGIRTYRGFLSVHNSHVDRNTAPYGGGIRSNIGSLKITDSTVNDNAANSNTGIDRGGGGIFVKFGNFSLNDSEVSGNTSTIRGGGIFTEQASTQVSGSSIVNNYTDDEGGGIYSEQSPLTIERSTIAFNTALQRGGGIHRIFEPDMSPLSVVDSQIIGNTTAGSGGGVSVTRAIEISGSSISANVASGSGGGISGGTISVVDSSISGNLSGTRGGGISTVFTVTITDSTVNDNTTYGMGGGIYARGLNMSGTTLSGNVASEEGGGIASEEDNPLIITESRISGNTAGLGGGGIYGRGSLSITNSEIYGNTSSDDGGGIRFQNGDLTILQSSLHQNNTTNHGGAVYSRNSNAVVTDSLVSRNSAGGDGGGISALSGAGTLELTGTVIDGNTSDGRGGGLIATPYVTNINFSTITGNSSVLEGGGIYSARNVHLNSSTVSNNSTYDRGGGWYHAIIQHASVIQDASLTIVSSTISGNQANENGGGLYVWSNGLPADISIAHSTVVENRTEGAGGGLFLSTGTFAIDHTILAQNEGALAPDLTGLVGVSFDAHYSLIGDGTLSGLAEAPMGSPDANGNQIGGTVNGSIDPLLAEAAQNGGAGLTYNLLPGSPALDTGDTAAAAGVGSVPLHDGRGFFSRVANGRIDIGALERQSLAPLNLIVDTLNDTINGNYDAGDLSLREAVGLANGSLGTLDTIAFAPALITHGPATLALSLGELAMTDSLTLTGSGQELLTLDASASDMTPTEKNGDGSRLFNIENGNFMPDVFVTIEDLTMTGGDVNGDGGAIRVSRENLSLNRVTLSNNAATGGGGAIYSRGGGAQLNVRFSTLDHNTGRSGGAIYAVASSGGSVSIDHSTIHDNQATFSDPFFPQRGGGVFFHFSYNSDAHFDINSSTISGNSAGREGGGIYHGGDNLAVRSSTITNNTSVSEGGGIGTQSDRQQILLENTIVAGNASTATTLHDVAARSTLHYSLVGDETGAQPQFIFNSILGTATAPINPLLGPLADNGGLTPTHALLPGSPAINTGGLDPPVIDPLLDLFVASGEYSLPHSYVASANRNSAFTPPIYDQRWIGFSRDQLGQVDIGAYEAQIPPSADFDTDGDVDGFDFLAWQRGFGKANAQRADGNSDDDTDTDASDLAAWQVSFGQPQTLIAATVGGDSAGSEPAAIPLSTPSVQAQLVDAVMAWELANQTNEEAGDSEITKPTAIEALFASHSDTVKLYPTFTFVAEDLSPSTIENYSDKPSDPWLDEELLQRVFG